MGGAVDLLGSIGGLGAGSLPGREVGGGRWPARALAASGVVGGGITLQWARSES